MTIGDDDVHSSIIQSGDDDISALDAVGSGNCNTASDDAAELYRRGFAYEHGKGCEKNIESAVKCYLAAADSGCKKSKDALLRLEKETERLREIKKRSDELYPEAQYELGLHYEYGGLTEKIPPLAVKLYEAAVQSGHAGAAFRLGMCCEKGFGTAVREKKAFEMYLLAAESGISRYRVYYARCLESGLGTDIDIDAAAKIYTEEAGKGSIVAAYLLNCMRKRGLCKNNYAAEKICSSFEKGSFRADRDEEKLYSDDAEAGYAREEFYLGLIYSVLGEKNYDDKAFSLFCRAAEKGIGDAAYCAALCLYNGEGVEADESLALRCLYTAAQDGCISACYKYALSLSDDESRAYYLERAAAANHAPSMIYLSFLCDTGSGTEKNQSRAYNLVQAAEKNPDSIDDDDVNYFRERSYSDETALYITALMTECKGKKEEGFSYMRAAAEKGSVTAQFRIGDMYSRGSGVKKDDAEAFLHFRDAAEKGHTEAVYRLGTCYSEGKGTEKNLQAAFDCFNEAAASGNPNALYALGKMYEDGICTLCDKDTAYELYRRAARGGQDDARRKTEEHFRAMKSIGINLHAAKNGDSAAQYEMYIAYSKGDDICENEAEAYKWLERAAEGGNANARYTMGIAYRDGIHFHRSTRQAVKFLSLASAQGHERAAESLAELRSDEQALALYRKTVAGGTNLLPEMERLSGAIKRNAESGRTWAMYLYGRFCETAGDTEKNVFKALTWYKKAASLGHSYALYELGEHILTGRGAGRESANAFSFFGKAAEKGAPEAQYRTGYCYDVGAYVGQSPEMAYSWYKTAAENGSLPAKYRLGLCFENGAGTQKDTEVARDIYTSIKDDYAKAKYRLAHIYLSEGRKAEGTELLLEAAEAGCSYALAECGMRYRLGIDFEKDDDTAYACFAKGMRNKSVMSITLAAMSIRRGKKNSASYEFAKKLFSSAAKYNSPQALYALSVMLKTENPSEAEKKLVLAAYLGDERAQKELLRRMDGKTLLRELFGIDEKTAVVCENAANDAKSLFLLGLCRETGCGTKKNIPGALSAYRAAAALNNADAMFRICMLYETGKLEYDGDDADMMCIRAFFAGNRLAASRADVLDLA